MACNMKLCRRLDGRSLKHGAKAVQIPETLAETATPSPVGRPRTGFFKACEGASKRALLIRSRIRQGLNPLQHCSPYLRFGVMRVRIAVHASGSTAGIAGCGISRVAYGSERGGGQETARIRFPHDRSCFRNSLVRPWSFTTCVSGTPVETGLGPVL